MKPKAPYFVIPILLMPILAVGFFSLSRGLHHEDLKVLGVIPAFNLTERNGQNFLLSDLQKKVWIASFIFTRCYGQCPHISSQMKRLQNEIIPLKRVRLVSISVDPVRDTPEVLSQYADKLGAKSGKWFFVTGEKTILNNLIQNGFHLSGVNSSEEINHSYKLCLVDKWARVRGYYDATDEAELRKLVKDAERLVQETF